MPISICQANGKLGVFAQLHGTKYLPLGDTNRLNYARILDAVPHDNLLDKFDSRGCKLFLRLSWKVASEDHNQPDRQAAHDTAQ